MGEAGQTAGRDRTSVIRLALEPAGDTLPNFHDFLLGLLKRRVRPATAQNVATAATELLDNAMAYATMASDIVLEISMDTLHMYIEVSNDTVASRVRVLREQVERLQAAPEETYMEEMRRSMAPRGPRSMMGLARVRHEAQMELSLRVSGDRVHLEARAPR